MSRKFQRKIQTVGGRLSPWKDDTNESRLIAAPVVQDARNNTEPIDDGSVQNKYWQKRRKSAQVSTEYSLNIVFFRIFKNIPESGLSLFSLGHAHQADRKPALHQNWQSSEKI